MNQSQRLQSIDQKIKDLQDKKRQLEKKQIGDLAKILKRVDAHLMPPDMLAGALIDVVEAFKNKQDTTHVWVKKGQELLKANRNAQGEDKNTSDSFPGSENSAEAAS
jgi:hypothetical protein